MKEKTISLLEGILWSKKQVSVIAASQVNNGVKFWLVRKLPNYDKNRGDRLATQKH
jgi:hypothetical protein